MAKESGHLVFCLFLASERVSWDQCTKVLDQNFHQYFFLLLVQCNHQIQLQVQVWITACGSSAACLNHVIRDESAQICSFPAIHVHCCICKLCLSKSDWYLVPELSLGPANCQVYTMQKHKCKYLSTFARKVYNRNLDSGSSMKGGNLFLPVFNSASE